MAEACEHGGHAWIPTGRADTHAFSHDNRGQPLKPVIYLRCASCRQNGFQMQHSKIVYTWGNEQ